MIDASGHRGFLLSSIGHLVQIHVFHPGPYQTNCYLITDDAGDCFLIDLGFEPEAELQWIQEHQLTPRRLHLTHAHVDHMAGVGAFRRAFPGVSVSIHQDEAGFLSDPERNLSAYMGRPISEAEADELVSHGDVLSCAGHHWQVIHVPGHSPGNTGLYAADERVLFSGDALFQGSIGRTDFPGGSLQVLTRAIRDRIYTLPGETRVLPGHGPSTTVGAEKATNPYVRS